jgi:phosphoribosylanthranilate isomerase
MTVVKICGITNIDDALAAVEAGADLIGFVFADSPRQVSTQTAECIITSLPSSIRTVGVFANISKNDITSIAGDCNLQVIQIHGSHDQTWYTLGLPVIRAFAGEVDANAIRSCTDTFVMLDGYARGFYGGTGMTCDWSLAKKVARQRKLFLAGGLTPRNISTAIRQVRPYAVDVSSGVEKSPGRKDHTKIKHFIDEVRSCDCRTSAAISGGLGDGLSPKR